MDRSHGPEIHVRRRAALPVIAGALALLVLYPWAWVAPVAETGLNQWVDSWLGGNEVSIVGTVTALWESDPALAVLVGALAVALPYVKALVMLAVALGWQAVRLALAVEWLGRFAMADVFLLAVYVAVTKGTSLGYLVPVWGLWLFTGCVLVSILLGLLVSRHARRLAHGVR